jgi:hypothetical protein
VTKAEPQMRAAQSQSLLATVKRLPTAEKGAILERASTATIEAIDGTLPLGWVSMTHHMRLSCAVRDELGTERNIELWRKTMVSSFERPFLRGFISMTTSLFGVSPASIFKRGGSMYEHITRNVGSMRYEPRSDNEGDCILSQFPAGLHDFSCYVDGLKGCLDATITICNSRGTVSVVERDDVRGDIRYRASWS